MEEHGRIALLHSDKSRVLCCLDLWRSEITIYTPARNVDMRVRTQCSYLRAL